MIDLTLAEAIALLRQIYKLADERKPDEILELLEENDFTKECRE